MADKADNGKAVLTRDRGRKPPSPGVHVAGVPQELRELARWVCWRWSWKDDGKGAGKWDKPPVMALRKGHASSNDPATWASFEDALSAYQRSTGGLDGVGFVLSRPYEVVKDGKTIRHDLPDDGLVGIDLDDAIDPATGHLKPWAAAIVGLLQTYTERSPTGTGVKLILKGNLPAWWARRKVRWHDGEVEVYAHGRYFTVTGLRLIDSPVVVESRQEELEEVLREIKEHLDLASAPAPARDSFEDLNRFHDSYCPRHPGFTLKARKTLTSCTDQELLDQAVNARNGPQLRALLNGDASAYDGDASRADEALCALLAFWCGPPAAGGPARVDRIFRSSGLMRGKWDEPHRGDGASYGRMTVEKAYHGRTTFHGDYTQDNNGHGNGKASSRQQAASRLQAEQQFQQAKAGRLAITQLVTTRLKTVKWLVPDYLPLGKLVMVAGDGGHGKSTFTLDTAAHITRGRCALGQDYQPPPPADVLIISCEDGIADTVVPRLVSAGADLTRCHHVDGIRDQEGKLYPFSLAHYEALEAYLKENLEVALVIIDPAGAFIGRSGIDDHKDSELRALLGPLAEIADRTGVCILLVKHINRNATARAVHRVSGSSGFVNAVRAAFMVAPSPDDEAVKLLLHIKGNLARRPASLSFRHEDVPHDEGLALLGGCALENPEERDELAGQLSRLRWLGPVEADADEVMAGGRKRDGGNKVDQCAGWLEGYLNGFAWPDDEVEQAARKEGYTVDNYRKAKKQLKGQGLNSRSRDFGGKWWIGMGDPAAWQTRPTGASAASDTSDTSDSSDSSDWPATLPIRQSDVSDESDVSDAEKTSEPRNDPEPPI